MRRFWIYPEDWRSIEGDALARFCQNARPTVTQSDQPALFDPASIRPR